MESKTTRTVLTAVINVLTFCAIVDTVRLGVRFSGKFAAHEWGKLVVTLSDPLVFPLGFRAVKTPYGGVFDVDAALMIAAFLVIETVLSGIRSDTGRRLSRERSE